MHVYGDLGAQLRHRDEVLAALVNERRRRGAADDVDPPAEELEPFGGEIDDHRGDGQLGGEPWLDRMTIARSDIDRLTGNLPAHVAGDDGERRFVRRTSGRNQILHANGDDDRRCDRCGEGAPGRPL